MRPFVRVTIAWLALILPLKAWAAETPARAAVLASCPKDTICASDPGTIAAELQALGYKAKIDTDKTGDPMISSAANGYNFHVLFYGCEKHVDCKSLSFSITFDKDSTNTPELANLWNKEHRFSSMSVLNDGGLNVGYDLTTVGGLPKATFGELVGWWTDTLGDLGQFFKDHPAK